MTAEGEVLAPPRPACQPFTFGGVAAFADAGTGRVLLMELLAALLVSASVVWFVHRAYAPVFAEALRKMPEGARIAGGRLMGVETTVISESKFLALAVTPESSTDIGQSADVQLQLRQTDFRVGTVFRPDWGWEFDYEQGELNLGRSNLEPWWGAWHPVLLAGTGAAVVIILMVMWVGLAVLYGAAGIVVSWMGDRQLSGGGAWRMASAALMPGALVMILGICLYGWQAVDLAGLLFFVVAHLLTGWVYVIGAVLARPRLSANPLKNNPFGD